MSSISAKQPLGFFDLPPEIRLRILEFTLLNPTAAPSVPAFGYVPIWRGRLGVPEDWHRKDRSLCNICARDTSSNVYCLWRRFGYLKTYACLRTCWCRSVPFSLFTVSKQMKAEAEYTFFKFNGFEFFLSRSLDVCRYFKGLTEHNLQLIRNLRFSFSYQQCEHWNERGRNDWRLLMNWIKYSANLGSLRIVIDVESRFEYPDCIWPYDATEFKDDPAYISLYRMVCEIALETVVIREKLQDLYLRFPYFHLLEKPLEQEIMGGNHNGHQGRGPRKALERRFPGNLSGGRLPPWHDIAWKEITNRYRELVYLLEQSKV